MITERRSTSRHTGFWLSLPFLGGLRFWWEKGSEHSVQRNWTPVTDERSGLKPSIASDKPEMPSLAEPGTWVPASGVRGRS